MSFGARSPPLATSLTLQRLFECTTCSLTAFESFTTTFSDAQNSLPIAQGLINSASITDVNFSNCSLFQDQESTQLFKDIMGMKADLHALCCRNVWATESRSGIQLQLHLPVFSATV
jgi:hypothetical protein